MLFMNLLLLCLHIVAYKKIISLAPERKKIEMLVHIFHLNILLSRDQKVVLLRELTHNSESCKKWDRLCF